MNLVTTLDGSHTLYLPDIDEHYHSTFGAITESVHIFVHAGFNYFTENACLTIFEVGFGTGLNALLTCIASVENKKSVIYYAIEKNPVSLHLVDQLNYSRLLPAHNNADELFAKIHTAPWNQPVEILPCFTLHKIESDIIGYHPGFNYDLIYFDAFAPDKQPEIWQAGVFSALFQRLNNKGILITYCVKGLVKRTLKSVGFLIEKLPGPPGKREILRGLKKICIE
jgi:tRNA U34 5-methylaminomethyl-2-thiouridine-forming methyltransferase MnmC